MGENIISDFLETPPQTESKYYGEGERPFPEYFALIEDIEENGIPAENSEKKFVMEWDAPARKDRCRHLPPRSYWTGKFDATMHQLSGLQARPYFYDYTFDMKPPEHEISCVICWAKDDLKPFLNNNSAVDCIEYVCLRCRYTARNLSKHLWGPSTKWDHLETW